MRETMERITRVLPLGLIVCLWSVGTAPIFGGEPIQGVVADVTYGDNNLLAGSVGCRVYSLQDPNTNAYFGGACLNARCLRPYSQASFRYACQAENTVAYGGDADNQIFYELIDGQANTGACNHAAYFAVQGQVASNGTSTIPLGNPFAAGCTGNTEVNCFTRVDSSNAQGSPGMCYYFPEDFGVIGNIGGFSPVPHPCVNEIGSAACPYHQIRVTWREPETYAGAMKNQVSSPVLGVRLYKIDGSCDACPTGGEPGWTPIGVFPLGAGTTGVCVPYAGDAMFALTVRLRGPSGGSSEIESGRIGTSGFVGSNSRCFRSTSCPFNGPENGLYDACDDNNPCTTNDACNSGDCYGQRYVPDGTGCDDGNRCMVGERTCQNGTCTGASPVVCQPSDACHVASCNPANGTCINANATNGTSCNDGNSCTQSDICQSGACMGSNPMADGTACNDGHGCTVMEYCQSGSCLEPAAFTSTGATWITGSQPTSIAAGDLNGDAILDLAVLNRGSRTVTILLGDSFGGFTPGPASPILGVSPQSIAAGDLNGDGSLDLAVANRSTHNVSILLGNGSGGFTSAVGSPVAAGINTAPYSVVIGDLNWDGSLDLAVASDSSAGTVVILLGNGSGGFTPASESPIAVGAHPQAVSAGYFNGDGSLDLAVANNSSATVTILLGNGSGGFAQAAGSPVAVGTQPDFVAVGDFDADGRLDLAVTNYSASTVGTVSILLGNGYGGFTPGPGSPIVVGLNPQSVAVGDLNGDGKLDLAMALVGDPDNTVTILIGNGSGGFSQLVGSPIATGLPQYAIATGDLNGDGKLDLAATSLVGSSVKILLNTSGRVSSPAAEVDSGLRVRRSAGAAVISWNLAACAASSDVLRGRVIGLPVGPGAGDETCLANGLPPTTLTWTDGASPGTGAAFWYLVRGDSPGGHGPYGFQAVNGVPGAQEVSVTCP